MARGYNLSVSGSYLSLNSTGSANEQLTGFPSLRAGVHITFKAPTARTASASSCGSTPLMTLKSDILPSVPILKPTTTRP